MSLKVFYGFQLDMASEFTGLKPSQINTLKRHNVVSPKKTAQGFSYSFVDILLLRLCKQMRENGVPLNKIYQAHKYLKDIDPEKKLTNLVLAVRKDTGDIIELGEDLTVALSAHGQLIMRGVVVTLPVGKQLERVRRDVTDMDKRLSQGITAKKTVSLEAMKRRYGIA